MDLDLTCVASLLALLSEEHYGRAAKRLNLTPSALTKRIQRLERQVGTPLVVRHPEGGCSATPAGFRFAAQARILLAAAEAAKRAAHTVSQVERSVVTVGVPTGPARLFEQLDLRSAVRQVNARFPGTRLRLRDVPFPALTSELVGHHVDVLVTAAPVRHVGITSTPLPITDRRVGVVSHRHELAGAADVDVQDFARLPILYNPAVPDEWMSVFYLGDVRPKREAHLVAASSHDMPGVLQEMGRGHHVVIAPEMFAGLVKSRFHTVALRGAPEMRFYAAHRRADHRGPVRALVHALHSQSARGQE